jgi:hypothetical protein
MRSAKHFDETTASEEETFQSSFHPALAQQFGDHMPK